MIRVISGGLYTSIQDLGRFGYRNLGVPLAGAMDNYSARLANRIIGNTKNEAVMEITHIGPVLQFETNTEIVITGAGFSPTLNNYEIPLNKRVAVQVDSILKFGLPAYGLRAYLSVLGGFNTEKVLGSYSQYQGITTKESLEKEDVLKIPPFENVHEKVTASVKVSKMRFSSEFIDIYIGPDFHLLSKNQQEKLMEFKFTVSSESNRMAYILNGWEGSSTEEIITSPVQPGTVQLTPSGQCIILMRDAQTTGGYARVLQLTEKSINRLSQIRTGASFSFKLIEYQS